MGFAGFRTGGPYQRTIESNLEIENHALPYLRKRLHGGTPHLSFRTCREGVNCSDGNSKGPFQASEASQTVAAATSQTVVEQDCCGFCAPWHGL